MFVILTIQDKIKLHPKTKLANDAVLHELNNKYAGKLITNEGTAITANKIIKTISYQIMEGYIICECIFEVIVHKYFVNEIIEGKICRQEEDNIKVTTFNNDIICIKHNDFMDGCDKIYVKYHENNYINWVWHYEEEKYYFTNNEQVRVRVKEVDYENNKIYGSFESVGLGPISWWM